VGVVFRLVRRAGGVTRKKMLKFSRITTVI
jgi:hypothetical protein